MIKCKIKALLHVLSFIILLSGVLPCGVSADYISGNMDANKRVMVFTGTWTGGTTAGTTELKVFTKRAASYSMSDLNGTWHINNLVAGPGAPWWLRGTLGFVSNGYYNMTYFESDDLITPSNEDGTLQIIADGTITNTEIPTAMFRMDADKTVMVGTSTWPDTSTDFPVLLKKAASYSNSDMTGIWYDHSLASGPGAPNWSRSVHTVAANGASTSTRVENNGDTHTSSETMVLTSDGIMTISGFTEPLECAMDAGKTVLACTNTWATGGPDNGTTSISVAVKKAASYSLTDLVGTWDSNSLASALNFGWWERATITIAADGSFSGTAAYSDDATPQYISGTMAISSGGVVTPLVPGQYLLTAAANGYGSGIVTSSAGDINYLYPSSAYGAAAFNAGTLSIILTANASADSVASWSGNCSSTGGTPGAATCTIALMNGTKNTTVLFAKKPVRVAESASYYTAIQTAYNSAGINQTIQIQATGFTENLSLANTNSVHLKGGYSADFSSNPDWTTITGLQTFTGAPVTIEKLIIK
jgi:hypothetical protein